MCKRLNNHTIIYSSGPDMPLQVLNARTLMKQQAYVSSTPGSSLDLEWEHEGNLLLHFIIFINLTVHRQLYLCRDAGTNRG